MSTKPRVPAKERPNHVGGTANRDEVQERAYFRYVERGRIDGKAIDDWLTAETEIRQKTSNRIESQ